ncbi:PEP/pyruvate-binding domain-containing protein, partial [Desulfobacterales bacterium HSG16]|nr:PEP/pyruvate-binding domain-containing protein [Desulfobacterales bacterium HSG16]
NPDNILPRYLPGQNMTGQEFGGTRQEHNYKITEIFLREKIALSLGLQQLDVFITRILKTLFHQSSKLDEKKLHLLLNYDPHHAMMTLDESASSKANGIIYLGNKGVNLVRMNDFGLPVPPCFIVTTEVFRCLTIIDEFARARQNFEEKITKRIRTIERVTGKRFADPKNPLLFSVRSGSSISQPGMMDTFLNVGINEDIATGLAVETDNAFFAWDCYRRFLQGWGMSYGIDRNNFDALIAEAKKKQGVSKKRLLGGEGMKKVALAYKSMIYDSGYEIVENPFDQLLYTIKSVLESWESDKAKIYRKIMGISDDWGTAVTIQAMVFGNMSQTSGTGVFFTHNPRQSGGGMKLWGDFTVEDQGEDVVSGLVNTMPISISQQNFEKRSTDIILETHFPEIYTTLREWAGKLIYEKGWGPQEMEFTFESPSKNDLHLLQTRDMAMRKHKKVTTFHPESIEKRKKIGNGIGVSGGAMSGRVVFTLEEIDRWRKKEPKTHLILIRGDTVPDDISEIFAADGLLTARGGLTSHAAVVAHRLGKTCVVGCGNLECNEDARKCAFDSILLKSGGKISIDGHEGSVYEGDMKFKENQSRSSEIWKTV